MNELTDVQAAKEELQTSLRLRDRISNKDAIVTSADEQTTGDWFKEVRESFVDPPQNGE